MPDKATGESRDEIRDPVSDDAEPNDATVSASRDEDREPDVYIAANETLMAFWLPQGVSVADIGIDAAT